MKTMRNNAAAFLGAACALALFLPGSDSSAAPIEHMTDIGFEGATSGGPFPAATPGTLAGSWTRDTVGDAGANFFVVDDTPSPIKSPLVGFDLAAPAGGSQYVVTDNTVAFASVLAHSFTLPTPLDSATVTFDMFIQSTTAAHVDTGGGELVNASGDPFPTHQFGRVDIVTAAGFASDRFTVDAGDVAMTLVAPKVDGLFFPAKQFSFYSFDILSLAPGDYVLRFGAVGAGGLLQMGVDNVSLITLIPEPSTYALFATVFGLLLVGRAVRRRPAPVPAAVDDLG